MDAEAFVVALVRRSRNGTADALPAENAPDRRYPIPEGGTDEEGERVTIHARSLCVAVARLTEGEGPDPDDPDGQLAYNFVERVAK